MNLDTSQIFLAALVGVGLAAAAGFRVFVPVLLACVAVKFNWLPDAWVDTKTFAWMGKDIAIVGLCVAVFIEFVAYKVPYLDNLLDIVAGPMAVIAGTVLSSSFLVGIDDPFFKYSLGIIAGGSAAALFQSATTLGRLGSTKFTVGAINPIFALFEFVASFVLSIISIFLPFAIIFIMLAAVGFVYWLWQKRKKRLAPQITNAEG